MKPATETPAKRRRSTPRGHHHADRAPHIENTRAHYVLPEAKGLKVAVIGGVPGGALTAHLRWLRGASYKATHIPTDKVRSSLSLGSFELVVVLTDLIAHRHDDLIGKALAGHADIPRVDTTRRISVFCAGVHNHADQAVRLWVEKTRIKAERERKRRKRRTAPAQPSCSEDSRSAVPAPLRPFMVRSPPVLPKEGTKTHARRGRVVETASLNGMVSRRHRLLTPALLPSRERRKSQAPVAVEEIAAPVEEIAAPVEEIAALDTATLSRSRSRVHHVWRWSEARECWFLVVESVNDLEVTHLLEASHRLGWTLRFCFPGEPPKGTPDWVDED